MKLILGVLDMPYHREITAQERHAARRRAHRRMPTRHPATTGSYQTTGNVAEILEHRYSLFSLFATFRGQDLADRIAEAMAGRLDSVLSNAPPGERLFPEGALSAIESDFREFIDRRELDGRASGVPTKAALRGVNHRLAHPYAKSNPSRPSFWDTGLMEQSFRAWVEE
ncbi:MAG TPA: hypothetical protein VGR91_16420 [Stellaceae bacterium]|nr:hypothetical protein [Stellaceae bacterium]